MVRLLIGAIGMLWWSDIAGFHLEKDLKPLLNKDTNRLELRSAPNRDNLVKVRIVEVIARNARGIPWEFFEQIYLECAKCNKKRSDCTCSTANLPCIEEVSLRDISCSPERTVESPEKRLPDSPIQATSRSPLLRTASTFRQPRVPNRCMQALAACISFPQLCCAACSSSDGFEVNPCYDEYVSPFGLSEQCREDACCDCIFIFCPCCMPQEEI